MTLLDHLIVDMAHSGQRPRHSGETGDELESSGAEKNSNTKLENTVEAESREAGKNWREY